MLRKVLGNKWLWVGFAVCAGALGFTYGYLHQDMTAFMRSGALVVGAGIVLVANPVILGADLTNIFDENGYAETDQRYWDALGEPMPQGVLVNKSASLAVNLLGPLIGLVGTIISGYGDLLNCVLKFSKC